MIQAAAERLFGKPRKDFTDDELLILKAARSVYNNREDGSLDALQESPILLLQLRTLMERVTLTP